MSSRIFLSYSSQDKPFAKRIAVDLRARGFHVWFDEHDVNIGDSLQQVIEDGLAAADYALVILSPDSAASKWVELEVTIAIRRSLPLLPLLFRPCNVPDFLTQAVFADFTVEAQYFHSLDRVVDRVKQADDLPKDFFDELDKSPLMRLCRLALKTGMYPEGLRKVLVTTLREISRGKPDSWRPEIAIVYLWFLKELQETGRVTSGAWSILSGIVDDRKINTHLRTSTAGTLVAAGLHLLADSSLALPLELRCMDRLRNSELLHSDIMNNMRDFLSGEFSPPIRGALTTYCNLLLCLDEEARNYLLDLLEQQVAQLLPSASSALLLRELREYVSKPSGEYEELDKALFLLCESLRIRFSPSASAHDPATRGRQLVRAFLTERKSMADIPDMVDFFHLASLQEEQLDYTLHGIACDLLSPKQYDVMKRLHGEEFVYSLFASLITDPDIEVVLSLLALECLLEKEGFEALILDDRFPEIFHVPKQVGRDRLSLIAAQCSAMDGETHLNSVQSLVLMYKSLSSARDKKQFVGSLRQASQHPHVELLARYLQGKVSFENFSRQMNAG